MQTWLHFLFLFFAKDRLSSKCMACAFKSKKSWKSEKSTYVYVKTDLGGR